MTLKVQVRNAPQKEEWDAALERFIPLDDIYFSQGYHQSSATVIDGQPCFALITNDQQALFLPYLKCPIPGHTGFWDIQSAYGYGGPLAVHSDSHFLEQAWKTLVQIWKEEGGVAAFVRCHPLIQNDIFFNSCFQVNLDRPTVIVDLQQGLGAAFSGPDRAKHRREVSLVRRGGFITEVKEVCKSNLSIFIDLYESAMKRLGADPFYFFPKHYYDSLQSNLGSKLSLVQVRHSNDPDPVAACLVMWGRRWAHYHLSGTRIDDTGMNYTNALLQEVATEAIRRGLEGVHLGGGRSREPHDPLLRFKQWIGSQRLQFLTACKTLNKEYYERLIHDWRGRSNDTPQRWFLAYRQPY